MENLEIYVNCRFLFWLLLFSNAVISGKCTHLGFINVISSLIIDISFELCAHEPDIFCCLLLLFSVNRLRRCNWWNYVF